jgi:hypothetical protein
MGPLGTDILISGPHGVIAAVEVRNPERFDRAAAIEHRKHLLGSGALRHVDYLLLVSQDHGYLWNAQPAEAEPIAEFPMDVALSRYFSSGELSGRLRPSELELLVHDWLARIMWHDVDEQDPSVRELRRVGFLDAIKRGTTSMVLV